MDNREEIGKRFQEESAHMTDEEKIAKYRELRTKELAIVTNESKRKEAEDISYERILYRYWYQNFAQKTEQDILDDDALKLAWEIIYAIELPDKPEITEEDQKLIRNFYIKWITYYPHKYPADSKKYDKLWDTLSIAYHKLAKEIDANYALHELDWPMFLQVYDPDWKKALRRSKAKKNQEFIQKAAIYFKTADFDEITSVDFLFSQSEFEDMSFGPLSGNYSEGMTISEEVAEHLIDKISEGR